MIAATRSLYADFIRTFGNVLFAVCLLLAWGLMTLVGVVVQQGGDAQSYFSAYPAPIARLVLRLGFDNIYHAPYYVGMIGLILLSLAVCTFKRVIPARMPALRPVLIEKIPLNASLIVRGTQERVREQAEQFFAKRGWQIRKRQFGGAEWTFADKHNWARRGVLIAHIGFTIIAAGTTLYWWKGFSGDLPLVVGQSAPVAHRNAAIRLNSFHYTIEPIMTKGGMVYQPIDYVSNVTVTQGNGSSKNEIVRVNHPIDIDGSLYYQSSYGFALRFNVMHDGVRNAALSNKVYLVGDTIALPDSPRSILVGRFVPTVDKQTGMPASDPRVNDPAVVLQAQQNGADAGTALVAMNEPIDAGGGWRVTPRSYLMVSGLQYRYDPGVPLVGIGAFVLLAGLVISFYFLPARLFLRVEPASEAGACSVGLAAMTVKGYDIFEVQFTELAAEFERALRPAQLPSHLTLAEAT